MEGRIHFHSIIKSIRGRVIFYSDSDRLLFVNILRRFLDKHNIILVEFVIMDNHIHLLHTAQSKEHSMLFLGELQQNFSFWYNRFHSSHDKFFIPAKTFVKFTQEYRHNCSLYILQNPMVASPKDYPHPKKYRWSSYIFHYDFEDSAPMLVKSEFEMTKANKLFDLINHSKSISYNKCPLLRSGFEWRNNKLTDFLNVETGEIDSLYTKSEFKVIVQKNIISKHQEFSTERTERVAAYLEKHKHALAPISQALDVILSGRNYATLSLKEKESVIEDLFKYTNATQKQIIMLLDEDKNHIKEIYQKYMYK